METSKRIIDIIEDHESIVQFVYAVRISLDSGTPMPNFVPALHDTSVTDHLGKICEALNANGHE